MPDRKSLPGARCLCRDLWGGKWDGKGGTQVIDPECPEHGNQAPLADSTYRVHYSKMHRFKAGSAVEVRGATDRGVPVVKISAGLDASPEEALELAESILHARRVAMELTP